VAGLIYQFPFKSKYELTCPFGKKGSTWLCGYHSGVDYASRNHGGTGVVYPIYPGTVVGINVHGSAYGNNIEINHPDGFVSLYCHLERVYVKVGAFVTTESKIGLEGHTGGSGKFATHLHLEIHSGKYKYPSTIDPDKYIKERLGGKEVLKNIKIELNGVVKKVAAIEKDGNNYIKLQDLRDDKIIINYDAINKIPIVKVK